MLQYLNLVFRLVCSLAYSHHKIAEINSRLQETIDKVNNWATLNGFRFSATKTVCMSFYNGCEPVVLPDLWLGNHKIPAVESTKFLGLYWNRKLTWWVHINQLKVKATRSLNVMRTLSGTNWGAD